MNPNIRYRLQHKITGEIITTIGSLAQIEERQWPQEGWRILSRDMGTGKLDIVGVEIFDDDCVQYYVRNVRKVGVVKWANVGFWIVRELEKLRDINRWKIKVIGSVHDGGKK